MGGRFSVAMIGASALAVVCCLGLPLLAPAVAGGLAAGVGAPLWVAALIVVAGAAVVLAVRSRRETPSVELLYFDGCPNYVEYLPRLQATLAAAGVKPQVSLRHIESEEAALAERFVGSPTVRVNGRDVEPGAETRLEYGLQCRLYRTADGWAGSPPEEWVLAALGLKRGEADAYQNRTAAAS